MSGKMKIGVSACLLGQKVRFDGGHKHDKYLTEKLAQYFDYVPCCPEVAIGMGVPRPTIHLAHDIENPQVVGVKDKSIDVTEALTTYSKEYCQKLPEISGYILKGKSPTCGMERVKIYLSNNQVSKRGVGVFAKQLMQQYPYLPVEEEGRLTDPVLRENFIVRVFTLHRWQQMMADGITAKKLVQFHTQHKLLLLSHHPVEYRKLGKVIAKLDGIDLTSFANRYLLSIMTALKYKATRVKHTNVLQHCLGFLKQQLTAKEKVELQEVIFNYRTGEIPLIVPMTLLSHHFNNHPNDYIAQQLYFSPYPKDLSLRNQI